jgi:HD-GYP domain-containing protein (c-di-GMP phosphodiesterase class II)
MMKGPEREGMALKVYVAPDIDPSVFHNAGLEVLPLSQAAAAGLIAVPSAYLENGNPAVLQSAAAILVYVNQESDFNRLQLPPDVPADWSVGNPSANRLRSLVQSAQLRLQVQRIRAERDTHLKKLKELNAIGVALSTQRDPDQLLEMILQKSREITNADAGSLYLVEGDESSGKRLRFKISQNDSMKLNYEEFVMPISKGSIAGYVAATGETLNIPDVYQIPKDREYGFNRQFDESTGYRTASVLAIPMNNHKGEITGVIQLLNSKKEPVRLTRENSQQVIRPFDENDEDLVSSLASQAAVALENNILIKSIERLFEGFVTAAVTAIESRDPTTSGHSFRVADLTVELARVVDKLDTGRFGDIKFTYDEIKEIRYASLLHDFGKVGVRENVLVKAKKLYPLQLDLIRERFLHYRRAWEAEYYKSKLHMLENLGRPHFDAQSPQMDMLYKNRMNSLDDYWKFIVESNEPTVLAEGNFERLLRISAENDLLPPGIEGSLLTPDEVQLLSIRKGSLNERERVEIESHVTHTFLFLSKIPWTSELKQVPRIAYGHHEKLNGVGYPNRLSANDIPVQTRMMTISDIYDALTASDRPYKRAVPGEKALDIISSEVKAGQVDQDLFQLFVDAKIYRLTINK